MNTFDFLLSSSKNTPFIIVRITDRSGKTRCFETPLSIPVDLWNPHKQCPENIYLKSGKKINRCLNRLKIALHLLLERKEVLSEKAISNCIKKTCRKSVNYPKNSLLDYIYKYIQSRMHLIKISTYRRYCVFLKLLERYEASVMKHLMIKDVNAVFLKDFLKFGSKEYYNISTLYRTINFIKTVFNFLEKRGIRTFVYELELPKEKNEKSIVVLNETDLKKIKQTKVSQRLKAAKDWLLISCYTGQRISDFMKFNKTMVQKIMNKDCLLFTQQKTNKEILLPIHPEVDVILKQNNFSFPQKLSTPTYNRHIKEIARQAHICDTVFFNKRRGHRSVKCHIPKWQTISSHVGRRSFASNFYGKIPTALLMEATGHSTEQMFQKYINTIDPERTLALGKYFEDIYRSKTLL